MREEAENIKKSFDKACEECENKIIKSGKRCAFRNDNDYCEEYYSIKKWEDKYRNFMIEYMIKKVKISIIFAIISFMILIILMTIIYYSK